MIRRLALDTRAASAAEFALVLPLLLLFVFGIIDSGRFMWEWNQGEKGTQMGVRFASVTDPVDGGIGSLNFVGESVTVGGTTRTLTQGDNIPREALGLITCQGSSCTCTSSPCPGTRSFNSTAFNNIVARVKYFKPDVNAANVVVEYRGSGLGFAGDPTGMDISPLVTVKLRNLSFTPLTLFGLRNVSLPDFRSTLTMEDGAGSVSH